ncbi:MAG: bacterio-opsin activator domain-containing protein [Halovenus sp.]
MRAERRKLLDHIAEGVCAVDSDGVITYANDRVRTLLGASARELVGTDLAVAVPGGDRLAAACDAARDGEERTLEVSDDGRTLEVTVAPAEKGLSVVVADITERTRLREQLRTREDALDTQQAITEGILDSLPDPLYVVGEDGTFERWNDRLETVTGYDAGTLGRMQAVDLVAEDDQEDVETAMARVWNGERTTVEATIETAVGAHIPYELSGAPVRDEDGAVIGAAGIGRDVTAQRAQAERLSGILEMTRSLMQARDREHVAEIAVNAAADVLGFDINVFRLYDSDAGTLEPVAVSQSATESLGTRPVYDVGEGNPGEVFASGESRLVEDVDPDGGLGDLRSVMYYPVGVHGIISVGSTERAAFDGTDEQVLALLATSAAAACMRAKREQEVREAREHTERVLDRVNGLIENTIEVLVQATTREELEHGVVGELAAAEPYSFAFVGQPDVATETLSPTAWDGASMLPVEGISVDLTCGGDPVSDAYREGTPQVLPTIGETGGRWADLTEGHDVDALIAVPLVYKDATYGVLVVFDADATAFDERERLVLEALSRAVANGINAIERGRILDATEIIELEFAVADRDLLFNRLSAAGNCTIESAGSEYRSDGSLRLYLSVTDADVDDLLAIVRDDPAVDDVTCIVEHENECLLDVVVAESLLGRLTEYGAVPRAVVAANGSTEFTVELPYESEARELFELVDDRHPGTDLLGYHERERPVETRQEFKAALAERFTDRQETALRTAYLGGFFDWPREVDGNELAEAMGISRPTYHQHLRTAQRKVFEELFESSARE